MLIDTVLRHGDVAAILPEVLNCIAAVFGADSAVLLLAGEEAQDLAVAASVGAYRQEFPVGARIPMPEAARTIVEGKPLELNDLFASASAPANSIGAAMFVDSTFLGSVHVAWADNVAADRNVARLQAFADRVALAIDHGRLYRAERIARSDAARAERRFRDLVHSLDAIVWEADVADWRFTFVSRRAEKMLGYPLRDWQATPDFWLKIAHRDDRAAIERQRQEMLKRGRGGAMKFRAYSADGRTLWFRALCEVVRDLAGVPRQMRGLMLDITQRRRAERDALLLAAIVESTDEAIIGKDLSGIIRTWNAGAEKMYGYTAAEVVGRPVTVLEPPQRRGEIDEIMRKLRAGEPISHMETQRRRKDGEIIDVALTVSPIRDPKSNAVLGASAIARDITGMKRAERTLRNTEKLAATGRLAASIAHEINNPMASVTNLLYLLEHHGTLDATATEYVKLAQDELKRITHIVRQMLGFYRESESPVAVDPAEVIDNVLLLYSRRLQNTKIDVQKNHRTDAQIQGFPGEIRQVFSNLLVNAIEAVGEKGRIRIDVRRARDWSSPKRTKGVRILVADDGPGIPETARKHIFEPFFTTKGERGTGLGLWVSEGIVRKHGGTMRVRSATGARHGTCFSLFFPAAPAQPARTKIA
ncbi:MAG: PAS domain S-box protein [Terriglobales bacterium]